METPCAECGQPFTCGAQAGSCWCMDLPRVSPVPGDRKSGCLCERCLAMKQSIVNFPAVTVACIRHIGYGPGIFQTWIKLSEWAKSRGIWNASAISYGISRDNPMQTPIDQCRYDACVEVPADFKFDGAVQRDDLPGGQYATLAFHGHGHEIGAAFQRVLNDVIPRLGKKPDFARPMFERYLVGGELDAEGRFSCDICVAVV